MKNYLFTVAAFLALASCTPKDAQTKVAKSETPSECCSETAESSSCCDTKMKTYANSHFYNDKGEFQVEIAKDAVIELMKFHNCPIYPNTRKSLWVSDYGTGQYTKLGLACVAYDNNIKDKYMQMDLYLMPGQMLPEHWHLDPTDTSIPAKREGWLIRWGKSYVAGIGEDNMSQFAGIKIPACHMNGEVETKHVVEAEAGTFVELAKVYSKHWQFAGENGAIITEVANCHDDKAVRHNDKAINDNFLGL